MTDPRWLNQDEARAWRGYRSLRALVDFRISRDLARDSGLSDPDYDVLSSLSEIEGHRWRLRDLAAHMLWSKSRLSHHISRMQERGLVTRQGCDSDGRGAYVVLTEEGLRAIEAAAPDHVDSVRRHLIDLLSEEQIRVLGDIAEVVLPHVATADEERRQPPHAQRPA